MLNDAGIDTWLLAVALLILANTLGGVIGTGVVVVFLVKRQDAAIHALEADHAKEMKRSDEEHQSVTQALMARIQMLESGHATLIGLLRSRSVISGPDADLIAADGTNDRVYMALRTLFRMSAIEVVAGEIGLDIEHVGGDSLPVVALRIVNQARHEGKYDALAAAVRRERPNAF